MVEIEHTEPEQEPKSLLLTRVTPRMMLLVIGAIVLLRLFVVETAYVDGLSMLDTLHQDDRVLILKFLKRDRFDIVVVDDPEEGGIDIKRIVGMPGDVLSMVPRMTGMAQAPVLVGGQLYIDSQPYNEPYAASLIPSSIPPVRIPDESYFVMGDNRDDSIDSRRYGPIEKKHVRGVAVAVVFPFNRFRILTNEGASPATVAAGTSN